MERNEKISDLKLQLIQVQDPISVQIGSLDVDVELHKLSSNLRTLAKLKATCGFEVARLDYEVSKRTAQRARELTEGVLSDLGMVRSDKFVFIKHELASERQDLENMRVQYRYFDDLWATYLEWINVYKKTRMLTGGVE